MPSHSMMMMPLFWSPLLLCLLIQIAHLANGNGNNAIYHYHYGGIVSNKIVLGVTNQIYQKMPDVLKQERKELIEHAFYAKGALEEFKALSHTKVEDLNHHQKQKEMKELEKKILKIFSEAPEPAEGNYEDNLKQKVENTIKAVGKAVAFYDPKNPNEEYTAHESKDPKKNPNDEQTAHESKDPKKNPNDEHTAHESKDPKKNPNDEHTAHESKMQMEDKKKMFEEWEQMSKFHTWLREKVQQIVEIGEKAKEDEKKMAQKILELLQKPGSPFVALHEGGTVNEETNENAGGGHHHDELHPHHHQHLEDPRSGSRKQKKDKQKSDGNGTR